jgi:hypothetical protein
LLSVVKATVNVSQISDAGYGEVTGIFIRKAPEYEIAVDVAGYVVK